MKFIALLIFLFKVGIVFSNDISKKNIGHHYIDTVAKKIIFKIKPLYNHNNITCSPDFKNKNWMCYLYLYRDKKEEKWTLVINFIDDKFSFHEGFLREFSE